VTRYDYDVHWYAALFPDLPSADHEKLKDDVRANGQLQPIVITREGMLLDGRHRMKICHELGITPYTILFRDVHNVRPEMSEVDFIDSVNLHRRHMSDDQRLALAVLRSDGLQKEAADRQKAGVKPPSGVSAQRSRTTIAKSVKQSEHRVKAAQQLKKQKPDALKAISLGQKTLKDTLKEAQEHVSKKDKGSPSNESKPEVPEEAEILTPAKGAAWLHLCIRAFEVRQMADLDPGDVRDELDQIPRDGDIALLVPLLHLRDWIAAVLSDTDRAKWYTEHETSGKSFLDGSRNPTAIHD
jgi:hypothetical protein